MTSTWETDMTANRSCRRASDLLFFVSMMRGLRRSRWLQAFAAATAVCVYASSTPRLGAQTAAARTFDVVSVKPNTSGATGGTIQSPPGRFIARNISLRMLLRNAFGVLDSQILSGQTLVTPDYLAAEKFDIEGTYAGPQASRDELNGMVRAMLADRFKLVVHRE